MTDIGPLDALAASLILNGVEDNRAKIARQSLEPVVNRLTAENEALRDRVAELEGALDSGLAALRYAQASIDKGSRLTAAGLSGAIRDADQALKGGAS